eukprot:3059284-Amphidinium_carterae.2
MVQLRGVHMLGQLCMRFLSARTPVHKGLVLSSAKVRLLELIGMGALAYKTERLHCANQIDLWHTQNEPPAPICKKCLAWECGMWKLSTCVASPISKLHCEPSFSYKSYAEHQKLYLHQHFSTDALSKGRILSHGRLRPVGSRSCHNQRTKGSNGCMCN